jgi:hypothetical protein
MAWLLAFLLAISPLARGDGAFRIRIAAVPDSGMLVITPLASGPADRVLRYEVRAEQQSPGGKSTSVQAGTVRLAPRGETALSRLAFALSPGIRYEIVVRLFEGDAPVGESRLAYPQ